MSRATSRRRRKSIPFIAVDNDDENTRTGESLNAGIDLLIAENENPNSVFYHKIDLDHISIGGHSQGGPAVFLKRSRTVYGSRSFFALKGGGAYRRMMLRLSGMKCNTVRLLCQKKDNGLYKWRKRRVGGNMKLAVSNKKQRDTTESENHVTSLYRNCGCSPYDDWGLSAMRC